jgi:16S rRNA (cytosine967-C5)-methyltransferase
VSPEGKALEGLRPRRLALQVLLDYERRDAFLNVLLSGALDSSDLDRRETAFTSELVRGTVEMKLALDFALARFSSRPLDSLHPPVLWGLRLGACQLLYMNVPAHAAINTTVELVKRSAGAGPSSFCNGVLRALERGRDDIAWPSKKDDPVRHMEIVHSHPEWVVKMWSLELSEEKAESICKADNERRTLSVRVNLRRAKREDVADSLRSREIEVTESALAPEGLLLKGTGSVASLEEHRAGLITVQDHGSMVVGRAVGALAGMSVLDMCAAPGGKANHLCELMGEEGSVLAVDVNESRLGLAEETALRLGNGALRTMVADARRLSSMTSERFDRVLLDAPCTGLGVLSRRPDARWRREPGDVKRLSELQSELLDEAAKMLKPGGVLVYSTCTISKQENEDNVEEFVSTHGDMEPLALRGFPGEDAGRLRLYPDTHGCDGMFAAAMRSKVNS